MPLFLCSVLSVGFYGSECHLSTPRTHTILVILCNPLSSGFCKGLVDPTLLPTNPLCCVYIHTTDTILLGIVNHHTLDCLFSMYLQSFSSGENQLHALQIVAKRKRTDSELVIFLPRK